jgi:hypothetical protein
MKHEPETPLPWRVGDAGHTVFGPPNGNPSPQTVTMSKGVRKKDAAYIAHTANAYPKLVAALRRLAERMPNDTEGAYADGMKLLRDIGEAE